MNKTKRKTTKKSVFIRLLVLAVCVYMLTSLIGLWNTLNKSIAQRDALQQEYAAKKNSIEELKTMLNSDSDAAIIESEARRLGYVYPKEKVFRDDSY